MWPYCSTDPPDDRQAEKLPEDWASLTALARTSHDRAVSRANSQYDGEGQSFLRRIPDEHSTRPRLYEPLLESSARFADFGTLTFLSLGSQAAVARRVSGKREVLQFSAEQPRAFRAVGFPSISPWIHQGNIRCTLSTFPMNASIAFTWSEGVWLAFRGSISNTPNGDIQITSRTSPTDTSSRHPGEG